MPVKDKDAPGYRTLILRPQDLKSIRAAIKAGSVAATAAAAAAASDEDVSPGPSQWLPVSEDLIPPKGINNFAQLEKELMRIFANAIMFNADPDRGFGKAFVCPAEQDGHSGDGDATQMYEMDADGVVKDTRIMFAEVERIMSDLRSAERRSEERRSESVMVADGDGGPDTDGGAGDDVDELAGEVGVVARKRKRA